MNCFVLVGVLDLKSTVHFRCMGKLPKTFVTKTFKIIICKKQQKTKQKHLKK